MTSTIEEKMKQTTLKSNIFNDGFVRIPSIDVPEDVFTIKPFRKFIKDDVVMMQYEVA